MNIGPVREETTSTGYGTVVLFPGVTDVSSSQTPFAAHVARQVLSYPSFQEHVKSFVEGSVAEYLLKRMATEATKMDDPFGAIYLSELKPDLVRRNDVNRIRRFSHIRDISDDISFTDGLDD